MTSQFGPLSQTLLKASRHGYRAISTTQAIQAVAAAKPASAESVTFPSSTSRGRAYVRKVATPAHTTSASTRTSPITARSASTVRSNNPPPLPPSAVGFDDIEGDHSLPDVSAGIDDYALLQPSSSTRSAEQPTPSPPLTTLPSGTSSLPIITASPDIQGEAVVAASVSDWTTSFAGLGEKAFPKEVANALLKPLEAADVEVKPDGLLYLPEIKYRRTLNAAFGPGGWGLAPRGETNVGPRIVSREWGLIAMGRLVSVARGEQEYFDPSGVPTATEACKSNALMRCCKDLGIASELWDPRFIREFKAKYCVEVFVEHQTSKKKRKLWRKKDGKFEYPYKEG